jgi:hypothetical protein
MAGFVRLGNDFSWANLDGHKAEVIEFFRQPSMVFGGGIARAVEAHWDLVGAYYMPRNGNEELFSERMAAFEQACRDRLGEPAPPPPVGELLADAQADNFVRQMLSVGAVPRRNGQGYYWEMPSYWVSPAPPLEDRHRQALEELSASGAIALSWANDTAVLVQLPLL